METVAGIVLGFFCGSLPPGYWIGRVCFGRDIRKEGSGNIGATNAFRVLGPWVGGIVLCLDVLKGCLAVWLSRQIHGIDELSGLAAVLGHTFSPFLNFRGGKGVATGLGVFLSLALKPALIAFGTFIAVFLIGRRVSPASCLAALALGVSMPLLSRDLILISVAEICAFVVLVRHRGNIARLWRGEEPRLF